jgi:hypothetical protein
MLAGIDFLVNATVGERSQRNFRGAATASERSQ